MPFSSVGLHKSFIFTGAIKVIMLTHTYPHKAQVAIYNHHTDSPLCMFCSLMSDLCFDTNMTPNVLTKSGVIKQHQKTTPVILIFQLMNQSAKHIIFTIFRLLLSAAFYSASGWVSLLLPRQTKLPRQCYSDDVGNLDNLGSDKEIQPELLCVYFGMKSIILLTGGIEPNSLNPKVCGLGLPGNAVEEQQQQQ